MNITNLNIEILDISESMTDDSSIMKFKNLRVVTCSFCENITGRSFNPKTLKILNCYHCPNIKDQELSRFINLEILNCGIEPDLCSICGLNPNTITNKSIEKMTNLKELHCEYRETITDKTLSNLKNLTKLHCSFCPGITFEDHIPNLTHLTCSLKLRKYWASKLPNLIELRLIGGMIGLHDETALYSFKKLKILSIPGNHLTDLSTGHFNNLEELYCNGSEITDKFIESISNTIKKLDITFVNKITDKSLKLCSKLVYLDCCNSDRITDKSISLLPNLEFLHCGRCPNITNKSVSNLKKLRKLICWSTNITGESIGTLLTLRKLVFDDSNKISDEVLLKLPNLIILYSCCTIKNLKITDKSISRSLKLKELYCKNCPNITDKSISKLINLKKITYTGCPFITIESMKKLPNLCVVSNGTSFSESVQIKKKYFHHIEY